MLILAQRGGCGYVRLTYITDYQLNCPSYISQYFYLLSITQTTKPNPRYSREKKGNDIPQPLQLLFPHILRPGYETATCLRPAETVESLSHVPFRRGVEECQLIAWFETFGAGEDGEGVWG